METISVLVEVINAQGANIEDRPQEEVKEGCFHKQGSACARPTISPKSLLGKVVPCDTDATYCNPVLKEF